MKRPFFPRIKPGPRLWLLVHGGIAAAFLLSLILIGPVRINTDLFDLLPASHGSKPAAAADRVLGARTGRGVYILCGGDDFSQAREGALALYRALEPSAAFESLTLFVDDAVTASFSAFLHEYRYALLDDETRELLESGRGEALAGEALAETYGAFTFTSLDRLETDPFLLAGRETRRFLQTALLSSGSLSPREDVLAARQGERWYVLIQGDLSPAASALTNRSSGVGLIYAQAEAIAARLPGLDFVYSGVPFHSYASSSSAQREISLISTISLVMVLGLFLLIFRSPLPVAASLGAIGVSIALALGSTLLFFREIHALTFVFGATLIGISVDYSVHFFVHRLRGGLTCPEILDRIRRGLAMSLLSSEICFAVMLLAPFAILRQFAVFSMAGLLSSWLSVVCLYARLGSGGRTLPPPPPHAPLPIPRILLPVLIALGLIVLFVNRDRVRVENNITGLYTMPENLRESERIAASVLNHGASPWYFIVRGDSPEEVLQHEEALRAALDGEVRRGNLGAYLASSLFIPSLKTQERNYEAAAALLPLAEAQFAALGLGPESAALFREDYRAAGEKRLVPGGDAPPLIETLSRKIWIGEVKGTYFSCVLPLRAGDEEPFKRLAADQGSVYFVNKVRDIGEELDSLTRIMLLLFAASWLVIAGVVRFTYSWRDTARICAAPVLPVLAVTATLAAADIPLGFFSLTGLALVFGLGLDYMFYLIEGAPPDRRPAALAVLLSFATTALSFGALALSSFAPVHLFGLTVFVGLTAAFLFAMLMSG
jgi:predicted exporter